MSYVLHVDVLHADKHESLLRVDSIICIGFGQACPKYPGESAISLDILIKKPGMKLGVKQNHFNQIPVLNDKQISTVIQFLKQVNHDSM